MRIEQIMVHDVISISPSTSLEEALNISKKHRIRHIPVVDHGELVGILSDRDLRDACPSCFEETDMSLMKDIPARSLMRTNVITIHPLDFVEDAARLLYEHHIGCLPVVSDNKLVGIISERDILHTLLEMMGVTSATTRVEIVVPDRTGMLANIADLLRARRINVESVLVYPSDQPGFKKLVFRIKTLDPRRFIQDVEALGYHVVQPPSSFGQ